MPAVSTPGTGSPDAASADASATSPRASVDPSAESSHPLDRLGTPIGSPGLGAVRAVPARFHARGKKRGGTRLVFRLERKARIAITVYGPGPSCNRLGTYGSQGHAGVNRIRFSGRLYGQPLPPGRYAVVVEAVRGRKRTRLGRVIVVILARDGREGGNRSLLPPYCGVVTPTSGGTLADSGQTLGPLGGSSSGESGVAGVSETQGDEDGLLPGLDGFTALPSLPVAGALEFPWLWLLAGVIGGLCALGATAGAVYYVRRFHHSWY